MASAPSERPPVAGRIDCAGRLVAADPALESLQREAGSSLGQQLALPQIAVVADLARNLGIAVTRPAVAASADHDIALWVEATPDGDDILLSLQGWTERPSAAPRLASLLGGVAEAESAEAHNEWAADEELRLISLSLGLAEHLGVDVTDAAGQPLTRAMRLIENEHGEMPLISALAGRRSFTGQKAVSRTDESRTLVLSGEVVAAADGPFAGFRGTALIEQPEEDSAASSGDVDFDHALEDVLRSPIDRIIDSAERIVQRADGPLRHDYASYGNDIAAAARHLLSVVRSMSEEPAAGQRTIDLAQLAAEAVVLVESLADERNASIEAVTSGPLPASGQEPAVIQILVNLIGNALRHSPQGSVVRLAFERTADTASVSVSDQGPGIAPADQQRIFERFERVEPKPDGTGLGLAISRRLARSMGGDVTLDSTPGEGARFTLTLPRQ